MRIHVKAGDRNIRLAFPTAFLFNRASVWLWLKIGRLTVKRSRKQFEEMPENAEWVFANIPDRAVMALCAELMRVKRKHGKWTLVEVSASGGEQVTISL